MDKQEIQARQFFLKGTIDRFENDKAVIKLNNGGQIIWPKNNLPEDAGEGSAIRLILSTSKTDEKEKEKIAKSLLNELLKTKKNPS